MTVIAFRQVRDIEAIKVTGQNYHEVLEFLHGAPIPETDVKVGGRAFYDSLAYGGIHLNFPADGSTRESLKVTLVDEAKAFYIRKNHYLVKSDGKAIPKDFSSTKFKASFQS
jgi:hypothetical protein